MSIFKFRHTGDTHPLYQIKTVRKQIYAMLTLPGVTTSLYFLVKKYVLNTTSKDAAARAMEVLKQSAAMEHMYTPFVSGEKRSPLRYFVFGEPGKADVPKYRMHAVLEKPRVFVGPQSVITEWQQYAGDPPGAQLGMLLE